MSKLIRTLLFAAAFFYALLLVFIKRDIDRIRLGFGRRNGFVIATLIFCSAIMLAVQSRDQAPEKEKHSSGAAAAAADANNYSLLIPMLKSAWLALDSSKSDNFKKKLAEAVQKGLLKKDQSILIARLYDDLSGDIYRKNNVVTCYKTMIHGAIKDNSVNAILQQLELLNKMKNENKLGEDVISKIKKSMAYDVETIKEFHDILAETKNVDKNMEFVELKKNYEEKTLKVSDDAKNVSDIIVEIEKTRDKWDLIKGRKKSRR